ncbi:MAG: LamG domain-containing protein [Nanobdellota archaeon]
MVNRGDSRGLSTIVATLLMILLTLVAVGIVWVIIKNVINQGTEEISLGKLTLDLEVKGVMINPTFPNNLSVKVKRNSGKGDMFGIKLIFYDGDTSEVIELMNYTLKELEERNIIINLSEISNSSNIQKVTIVPILRLESGKEVVGNLNDEYEVPKTSVRSTPPSCTPATCGTKQCGTWANGTCSGTLVCGSYGGGCQSGYTCNTTTGQCVVSSTPSIQTGLVSWWKFNGDATDSVGDNDGTTNGVASTSIGCKAGQCYIFSGVNQNIVVPNSNTLNFPTGGTVSLWANVLTPTTDYDMPLWRGGSSNGEQGYDLELGTGAWYVNIANGTSSRICQYSSSPLTGLHMLTFTFNSTGGLVCYVDGVNSSAPVSTAGFGGITSPYALYIGSSEGNYYDYNGSLDEIMIWNRSLNSTEIQQLYNYDYT